MCVENQAVANAQMRKQNSLMKDDIIYGCTKCYSNILITLILLQGLVEGSKWKCGGCIGAAVMIRSSLAKTFFLVFITLAATASLNVIKSNTPENLSLRQKHVFQSSRNLAIRDWLDDKPMNFSLSNKTCGLGERKALQAALLMAYVGFG